MRGRVVGSIGERSLDRESEALSTPASLDPGPCGSLKPEAFRRLYRDFAAQNPKWNEIPASTGNVYAFDAASTYIQEPPFFANFGMQPGTIAEIKGAEALEHMDYLPLEGVAASGDTRSAYMEWDADAPRQFVAVVTGGMNLVGLSTGPASPFNIAKPVVVQPLTAAQSQALAQATLDPAEIAAIGREMAQRRGVVMP